MEFALYCGTIPSVKNEPQPFVNYSKADKEAKRLVKENGHLTFADYKAIKKMNQLRIHRTDTYKKFIEEHKPEIQRQMQILSSRLQHKGLIFPIEKCITDMKFHCKYEYLEDSINKEETFLDLLVKAGAIADDNRFVAPKSTREAASYSDEILHNIVKITLTFNL